MKILLAFFGGIYDGHKTHGGGARLNIAHCETSACVVWQHTMAHLGFAVGTQWTMIHPGTSTCVLWRHAVEHRTLPNLCMCFVVPRDGDTVPGATMWGGWAN